MKEEVIYHMRIELDDANPRVWRTFKVSNLTPMPDFHLIVQSIMGWTNSHLHQFVVKGLNYAEPDPYNEIEFVDYTELTIGDLVKGGNISFKYEYDFGDSWIHTITLEKMSELNDNGRLPVCTGGAGSCPPEDCGGIPGYEELQKIIKDPSHEEYAEYRLWLGGDFDPEQFDVDFANGMLLLDNYGVLDESEEE